ncbi:hypothetical protein FHS85_004198 [Rhodoligotrophos appendicifer]|uniref:hypothetical protein n=1 Tax=Rhodoligotrophos appendicifer TaxID=987056 RepID=UPI001186007A|nr:hypothetical protein [Rhodoligotrophos appendicifer]
MKSIAVAFALTALASTAVLAEAPPSTDTARLLGPLARGVNYQVENPITSDGVLYVFKLATPYGNFRVDGEQLLKLRLHELAALEKLEALSQSGEFTKSLAAAVQQPIATVGKALVNPFSLVTGTVSGVGSMFDKVSAGLNDPYDKSDNAVDGLLGTSAALRQLAYQYDVDPYTKFPPLAKRLQTLAQAHAMGGLAVKGAVMAIPGGAGLAVSGLQSAGTLGSLVRDKTVAQLDEINQAALLAMGVNPTVMAAFMSNQHYTPADKTLVVAALKSMPRAANKTLYVAKIAGAADVDAAFFHRVQTQWMAAYNAKVEPITGFANVLGFPLLVRADGKLVGLFPMDILAWTDPVRKTVLAMSQKISAESGAPVEIRLSGTVTDEARREIAKVGWTVKDHDTALLNGN